MRRFKIKRFTIPLIEKNFFIYSGKDEWERFRKITIKEGADEELTSPCPKKGSGRCFRGHIWVFTLKDKRILIHELSHLLDDIMLTVGSEDTEFRAYLTEWIMFKVLEWRGKNG